MKQNVQARIDFIHKAEKGDYTAAEAEVELDRMEAQFGEAAFLPGTVRRKPKPWTERDLEELKDEATVGAGSREFLSYLAEVGSFVHERARARRRRRAILGAVAAVAAAAAIVTALIHLLRS